MTEWHSASFQTPKGVHVKPSSEYAIKQNDEPKKTDRIRKTFKMSITDRNSGSSHLNLIITCIVLEK